MSGLTILKEAIKAGLKTKTGKELMAKAMKSTGITKNSISKVFGRDPNLKSKLKTALKTGRGSGSGYSLAGIGSATGAAIYLKKLQIEEKKKEKAKKKLIAESNAATKKDAIAKIQKATSAAQRFKNRVKK
mgnify:CR=1 FL=1